MWVWIKKVVCIDVQVRAGDASPSSSDQWRCFDDVTVEPWDISNLDRDCFGGKYTLNPQHFKGAQQVGTWQLGIKSQ